MPNYVNFDSGSPTQQAILGSDPDLQQKWAMARLLLTQPQKPIRHWSDALPNITNQILGGLLSGQAGQEMEAQTSKLQRDTAAMLAGGQPGSWTNPDTGVAKEYGGGLEGMINKGLATNNPALQPQIQAMQLKQIENQAALKQAEAVARLKAQIAASQPQKFKPGDILRNPDGTIEYQAPFKSDVKSDDRVAQDISINDERERARADNRPPPPKWEAVPDASGNPLALKNPTTGDYKKDPRAKNNVLTTEFRKSWRGLEDLDAGLTDYKTQLGVSGTEVIRGPQKAKLRSIYTNVLMGAKELYTLGALTGPDMSVIQGILADPTSWDAAVTPTSAYYAQIEEVQKILTRAKQNLLKAYNNPPGFNVDAPEASTDTSAGIESTPTEIHYDQNGKRVP